MSLANFAEQSQAGSIQIDFAPEETTEEAFS
jgi:hypothetical protein